MCMNAEDMECSQRCALAHTWKQSDYPKLFLQLNLILDTFHCLQIFSNPFKNFYLIQIDIPPFTYISKFRFVELICFITYYMSLDFITYRIFELYWIGIYINRAWSISFYLRITLLCVVKIAIATAAQFRHGFANFSVGTNHKDCKERILQEFNNLKMWIKISMSFSVQRKLLHIV